MEILISTSTYFLDFSWSAESSYFGHIRHIYIVGIEGCLVVAYLERSQFQLLVNLSSYFFWSLNFTSWVCQS